MKVVFIEIVVLVIVIAAGEIACATDSKSARYDRLITALIQVESNGNDRALGDRHMENKAYGCLQIRKPCVDDVNRRFGSQVRIEDLLGNRSRSVWVCNKYLELYATPSRLGREPTFEDMARIWNGGPAGWKKESTIPYWAKVKKALEK